MNLEHEVSSPMVLNANQQEAVLHRDGPMVIFAGAGSGKTRVITTRVISLINLGVSPWEILAMTFTNKAAEEMRFRITQQDVLGKKVLVSTFHSCCARWLREFALELGFNSDFSIYDDKDSTGLLKQILSEHCTAKELAGMVAEHKAFIQWAKTRALLPKEVPEYCQHINRKIPEAAVDVYLKYQQELARANAMDFGDLLVNMLILFRHNKQVKNILSNRYRYMMVDEFQDTNTAQLELIKHLAAGHRNVVVVGDDDQSIYSWRGAMPSNIQEFRNYFAPCKVVRLGQNYRCSGNIVNAAAALIGNNRHRESKEIFTENPAGLPLEFVRESDNDMEACHIAASILTEKETFPLKEVAVFYRTNSQSRAIEEMLTQHNIPYTIYGSTAFYERLEVKDLLAYLKLVVNPQDNLALSRIVNVPKRGLGKKAFETISGHARAKQISLLKACEELVHTASGRLKTGLAGFLEDFAKIRLLKEMPLGSIIGELIAIIDYKKYLKENYKDTHEDKVENIHELQSAVAILFERKPETTLAAWIESVTMSRDEHIEKAVGGVTLMTLHMAKGLEFDRVYIAGLEDGYLPHQNSLDDKNKMEEERRLLYVGITRARKKLTMLAAERRYIFNQLKRQNVSRFLREIPQEYLNSRGIVNSYMDSDFLSLDYDFDRSGADLNSMQVGDRVFHLTYGRGTIKSITKSFGTDKFAVDFDEFGERLIKPSQLQLKP